MAKTKKVVSAEEVEKELTLADLKALQHIHGTLPPALQALFDQLSEED